ncbi:MAG: hypothetical protein Q8K78_17870 [Planctomycetaceae bacterium]|nr:hypothetical protein [Planctomycetaceae bacterium]
MNPAAGLTVFGTAITMVIGAALFACVASALCRCYQVWQAICRGQLQPASHDRPPKNTMLLPTSVVSRDFARQPPSKHCAP